MVRRGSPPKEQRTRLLPSRLVVYLRAGDGPLRPGRLPGVVPSPGRGASFGRSLAAHRGAAVVGVLEGPGAGGKRPTAAAL